MPGMGPVKSGMGPLRSGMNPFRHEMGPSSMNGALSIMKWALSVLARLFQAYPNLSFYRMLLQVTVINSSGLENLSTQDHIRLT